MKKKLDQENQSLYRDLNLGIAEHEAGLLLFERRSLVISNQFSYYRVFNKYDSPVVSTEMRPARFSPTVWNSTL
jgi:hypothetical protein